VFGDVSERELELLNGYTLLRESAQGDLQDYLHYLLSKQYQREVMVAVFHNRFLNNLIDDLVKMINLDGLEVGQIRKRILQIRELYFGVLEQVHRRYYEVVENLYTNEVAKDFGRCSFENLERALETQDIRLISAEVIDFYEQYNSLSKKKDARRLVAI